MSYPTERAAICAVCGAKQGRPCYGNGPMPIGSHPSRLLRAYQEEISRLRDQIDELAISGAAASK